MENVQGLRVTDVNSYEEMIQHVNSVQGLRITDVNSYEEMIQYINSNKSHSGELIVIINDPENDIYFKEDENGNKIYPKMYITVLENDEYNIFPLMDENGNYVDYEQNNLEGEI